MQLESGEYFLKAKEKEEREARKRQDKVCAVVLAICTFFSEKFLCYFIARGGYGRTTSKTRRSICCANGASCTYSGREAEKEKRERHRGRGYGWQEKKAFRRDFRFIAVFFVYNLTCFYAYIHNTFDMLYDGCCRRRRVSFLFFFPLHFRLK